VVGEACARGALRALDEMPQTYALRVEVVGRGPEGETARGPARDVEHERLTTGEEGPQRRRAARVKIDRLPFGRPAHEVQPRASNRPDPRRRAGLEDRHVAGYATLDGGLPDHTGGRQPGLLPGRGRVVDHDRDRVSMGKLRSGRDAR